MLISFLKTSLAYSNHKGNICHNKKYNIVRIVKYCLKTVTSKIRKVFSLECLKSVNDTKIFFD